MAATGGDAASDREGGKKKVERRRKGKEKEKETNKKGKRKKRIFFSIPSNLQKFFYNFYNKL